MQDLQTLIISHLNKHKTIRTSDIVKKTGFSRAYVQRILQRLKDEGKIVLLGKANMARYVVADKKAIRNAKVNLRSITKNIKNKNLSEDVILSSIKKNTGIFMDLPENITSMMNYMFTEMLNNAIDHSESELIRIEMNRKNDLITFMIADQGIGIFNNLMHSFKLKSHLESIQSLMKGKQTTAPEQHSGEGIFFTSKMADMMIIQSSEKKLTFNNIIDDVFIEDTKNTDGTIVKCTLYLDSKKTTDQVFRQYTDDSFSFSTTEVIVKLFTLGDTWVSRSQARRIVSGLEKFTTIKLDFRDIKTIGQGFADEIFRVWQSNYPNITILPENTSENVQFMIDRVGKS